MGTTGSTLSWLWCRSRTSTGNMRFCTHRHKSCRCSTAMDNTSAHRTSSQKPVPQFTSPTKSTKTGKLIKVTDSGQHTEHQAWLYYSSKGDHAGPKFSLNEGMVTWCGNLGLKLIALTNPINVALRHIQNVINGFCKQQCNKMESGKNWLWNGLVHFACAR